METPSFAVSDTSAANGASAASTSPPPFSTQRENGSNSSCDGEGQAVTGPNNLDEKPKEAVNGGCYRDDIISGAKQQQKGVQNNNNTKGQLIKESEVGEGEQASESGQEVSKV